MWTQLISGFQPKTETAGNSLFHPNYQFYKFVLVKLVLGWNHENLVGLGADGVKNESPGRNPVSGVQNPGRRVYRHGKIHISPWETALRVPKGDHFHAQNYPSKQGYSTSLTLFSSCNWVMSKLIQDMTRGNYLIYSCPQSILINWPWFTFFDWRSLGKVSLVLYEVRSFIWLVRWRATVVVYIGLYWWNLTTPYISHVTNAT